MKVASALEGLRISLGMKGLRLYVIRLNHFYYCQSQVICGGEVRLLLQVACKYYHTSPARYKGPY